MNLYLVAQHTAPEIVCPPWCASTEERHLAALTQLEGRVYHWSEDIQIPNRSGIGGSPNALTVALNQQALPDGSPDMDCAATHGEVVVVIDEVDFSLDAAAALVSTLTALIDSARNR